MTHPYFMTTARLGFGVWTAGHGALADAVWGDPVVTAMTGGPFAPDQVRDRLALEIANGERHGVQYWPVFDLASGAHLGCCGLRPRPGETEVFELGYQLRPEAWGRGIAAEAARGVIAWASAGRATALIAGHHPRNDASRAILVKLGFTYTHDEIYPPTGQMEPCYRLAL